MSQSASQAVIQYTDHHQQKLHQVVAQEASKVVGRQVAPADVNPDDQSPLIGIKDILGDSTHVAGSTMEEMLHGENTIRARITKGKVPISISAGKWLKRKLLGKKTA